MVGRNARSKQPRRSEEECSKRPLGSIMAPWDLQDEEIHGNTSGNHNMTVKKNKSTSTIVLFSSGISRLKFEDEGRIGGIRKKPPLLGSRDRFGRDVWPKKTRGFGIIEQYFEYVLYVGVLCVLTMVQKGCTSLDPHQWQCLIPYNSFIGVYNVDRYQLEGHDQSSNQPWGFSPRSKIEPVNNWCILIHVNGNGTYSITPPNDMG